MINPGKYNKKITFYRQIDSIQPENVKIRQKPVKLCTVFASVKAKTGTERYEVERLTNTVSYDIRTRFLKKLYDENLIIEYEGKRLEITSVVNVREENTELAFTCLNISKGGVRNYGYF